MIRNKNSKPTQQMNWNAKRKILYRQQMLIQDYKIKEKSQQMTLKNTKEKETNQRMVSQNKEEKSSQKTTEKINKINKNNKLSNINNFSKKLNTKQRMVCVNRNTAQQMNCGLKR